MNLISFPPLNSIDFLSLDDHTTTNQTNEKRKNKKSKHQLKNPDYKTASIAQQKLLSKLSECNVLHSPPVIKPYNESLINHTAKKEELNIEEEYIEEEDKDRITEQPNIEKTIEIVERNSFINLEKQIFDLSLTTQGIFEELLQESQKSASRLEKIFATSNKEYLAERDLNKSEIRERFRVIRENEKEQYQELCNSRKKLNGLFLERIHVLESAIKLLILESALLKHSIIGNDSYWKSYSILKGELGYRYGADFRLWELTDALEKRRQAIGIQKKSEPIPETTPLILLETEEMKVRQDLEKISAEIDILKEEVTICNEAFKRDVYKIVVNSDIPQQYYIFHKQRLYSLKNSVKTIYEKLNKRLEELSSKIEYESSTPTSPKALAYKQERVELMERYKKILSREVEIEDLLNQRKKHFKLIDEELSTKEPIQLEDLSEEYKEALSLISRIIGLKEDVILSNIWEGMSSLEQRMANYFQIAKKTESLAKEKAEFESQRLSQRLAVIEVTLTAYNRYLTNIRQSIKAIDKHFALLAKHALERANWQVEPVFKG